MRFLPALGCLICMGVAAAEPGAGGKDLFEKKCAYCHKIGAARTPWPDALAKLTNEKIIESLTTGVMRAQGAELTAEQYAAIAEFLTASASSSESSGTVNHAAGAETVKKNSCPAAAPALQSLA